LVELVGVIATYNMVSRFLVALQVTPEHRAWPLWADFFDSAFLFLRALRGLAIQPIAECYKHH
jgi:hypothetical protein